MLYAFQLRAHSNARYQVSLLSLSQKELACMLAVLIAAVLGIAVRVWFAGKEGRA